MGSLFGVHAGQQDRDSSVHSVVCWTLQVFLSSGIESRVYESISEVKSHSSKMFDQEYSESKANNLSRFAHVCELDVKLNLPPSRLSQAWDSTGNCVCLKALSIPKPFSSFYFLLASTSMRDYARNEDMPPGVLTKEELQELEELKVEVEEHEGWSNLDTLVNRKFRGAARVVRSHRPDYLVLDGLSRFEKRQYFTMSKARMSESSEVEWVLCNLTKREFIRESTVWAHGAEKPIGFGEFLLARICWSSDPSCAMSYKGHIHRGVWAGDRFEITTMDRMKTGEGEWKDVGDQAGKETADIGDSEHGQTWRKDKRGG